MTIPAPGGPLPNQMCQNCSRIPLGYGFPGGSAVKNPPANAGDTGSIPGSGRSLGVGNGNLLQYSCLKNPMDRRAWQAKVHRVAEMSEKT